MASTSAMASTAAPSGAMARAFSTSPLLAARLARAPATALAVDPLTLLAALAVADLADETALAAVSGALPADCLALPAAGSGAFPADSSTLVVTRRGGCV